MRQIRELAWNDCNHLGPCWSDVERRRIPANPVSDLKKDGRHEETRTPDLYRVNNLQAIWDCQNH
jgi:hypothetical protein